MKIINKIKEISDVYNNTYDDETIEKSELRHFKTGIIGTIGMLILMAVEVPGFVLSLTWSDAWYVIKMILMIALISAATEMFRVMFKTILILRKAKKLKELKQ